LRNSAGILADPRPEGDLLFSVPLERRQEQTSMTPCIEADRQREARSEVGSMVSNDSRRAPGDPHPCQDRRQRLQLIVVGRTAIVRFIDPELLFEQAAIRMIGDQLDDLIEGGYSRLLLNFSGLKYVSGALLGRLTRLQQQAAAVRCRIQLCGLDPLLREVLRITHLDLVFDVRGNEAEALGPALQ
jgi:anti-anti-sigma regulatory factor